MTMDPKQFKENLFLYGVDLNEWPEEIRQAGAESLRKSSELQTLLAEQEDFERILKTRKYKEPSGDLVQRIVSLSLLQDKKSPSGFGLFLSRLFADEFYFPKPALVLGSSLMIAALVFGFVIGFSISTGSISIDRKQANLQDFFHYEGNVQWAKE
jgi:hypothetical protein